MKDIIIGLDIGTSSLKLVALNINNNKSELEVGKPTAPARIDSQNTLFDEQNVNVLVNLAEELFKEIPDDIYDRVKAFQVCGQMHGIVLWNSQDCQHNHSNLITWQDLRCDCKFLENLPVHSISDLNSGFGCATLYWYALNNFPLEKYDSSGTIQDYFTFLMSTKQTTTMSDQNALSWGYFDFEKMHWQDDLKKCSVFPFKVLPNVSKPGTLVSDSSNIIGKNVPETPIYCSLGDLQCSVYSCLENDDDCVINISTSSQVCIAIDKSKYNTIKSKLPSSITIFPYFGDKILLVAASLNGGNVLENFVSMINDWNHELKLTNNDHQISTDKIWAGVIKAAEELTKEKTLICIPRLFAERHNKDTYGSLLNVKTDNTSIGEVFHSICTGIIENLQQMFPAELLKNEFKIKRIIGTGNALLKNSVMKKQLELQFNLPATYNRFSDAALGAASFIKDSLYSNEKKN